MGIVESSLLKRLIFPGMATPGGPIGVVLVEEDDEEEEGWTTVRERDRVSPVNIITRGKQN
jgi:hypothetical protein